MDINRKELSVLAARGCPDYCLIITRLAYVVALTVDKDAKRLIVGLYEQLLTNSAADEYSDIYKR